MNDYVDITSVRRRAKDAGINLANANKDRKYVEVLKRCMDFASCKEIYPGIKSPLHNMLNSLIKLGLLKKYSKQNFMSFNSSNNLVFRKVWFKITYDGLRFLQVIGAINKD